MLIKVPTRRTDTKISKRRTKPPKEDHLFPQPLPLGDLARLNHAHTKGGHSPLRLRVTGRNVLRNPTESKVNPRTLQPRRSAMYIL